MADCSSIVRERDQLRQCVAGLKAAETELVHKLAQAIDVLGRCRGTLTDPALVAEIDRVLAGD